MPPPATSATKRKGRHRDAPQVRLAVLLTDHPPLRTVQLAPDPALDLRTELEFEPVGPAAAPRGGPPRATFGLLHSNFIPRGLAMGRVPVKRGRWGSKPAETLQLLHPLADDQLNLPALRLRGLVRAAADALVDILAAGAAVAPPARGGPDAVQPATGRSTVRRPAGDASTQAAPTTTQLWLAAELALQGFIPTVDLRYFAAERGEQYPLPGVRAQPAGKRAMSAALIEQDGLLLWRSWLARQAARLAAALRVARARNPLRTQLDALQAARLLQLAEPAAAPAILDELAQQFQLRSKPGAPAVWLLSGELAPPVASAPDAAAAHTILGQFNADGTGPLLKDVRAAHLNRLHVLAWLLDAGVIVELHGGMLVLAAWLNRCLAAYPLRAGQAGPSVRELKDKLGYGRREAEALRVWYLQQGAK